MKLYGLAHIFNWPAFYFIKTGDCENVPFTPADLPIWIDEKYKELLNNL